VLVQPGPGEQELDVPGGDRLAVAPVAVAEGDGDALVVRGSEDDTSAWAAPLAGSAGGVLVVAAVVLWRGRRERHEDF
ncbi:hypothetical protein ACWDVV_22250, partial [Streptomyces tendae]